MSCVNNNTGFGGFVANTQATSEDTSCNPAGNPAEQTSAPAADTCGTGFNQAGFNDGFEPFAGGFGGFASNAPMCTTFGPGPTFRVGPMFNNTSSTPFSTNIATNEVAFPNTVTPIPPRAPTEVEHWASSLALGTLQSVAQATDPTTKRAANYYTYDNGTIGVDTTTGYMTGLQDNAKNTVPANIVDLSLQEGLGKFLGPSATNGDTVYNFQNGSIRSHGTQPTNESGTEDRANVIKSFGNDLGFGNLKNKVDDPDNAQVKYEFDNGNIYADAWSGAIRGGDFKNNSVGFSADVLNVAHAREFGAFKSIQTVGSSSKPTAYIFHFASGTVHVSVSGDGKTWTLDGAKH